MMILKNLTIRAPYSWEKNDDRFPYQGTVEFEGASGKIEVPLDGETSQAILSVVADRLVETAGSVADLIGREVIQGAAALPEPDEEGVS
jgi:hypothetical protein